MKLSFNYKDIMEENNKQQEQQNNGDKVQKAFDANIKKLIAVLGGKENLFPTKKIPSDSVGNLVDEMLKEQKVELAKNVKINLKEILDKKVILDKALKEEESKLAKLKEAKMKEFNDACLKVLNSIADIDKLEQNYYSSLSSSSFGTSNTTTNEETKE